MGRREHDHRSDDEGDRPRNRRAAGAPVWLPVLTGVGGAAIGLVLGFAVGAWAGAGAQRERAQQPPPAAPEAAPRISREEFRKRVMGKTPDEVIAVIGKPDRTADDGPTVYWYYKNRSFDPVTNRTDETTQVCFRRGVVDSVNY